MYSKKKGRRPCISTNVCRYEDRDNGVFMDLALPITLHTCSVHKSDLMVLIAQLSYKFQGVKQCPLHLYTNKHKHLIMIITCTHCHPKIHVCTYMYA